MVKDERRNPLQDSLALKALGVALAPGVDVGNLDVPHQVAPVGAEGERVVHVAAQDVVRDVVAAVGVDEDADHPEGLRGHELGVRRHDLHGAHCLGDIARELPDDPRINPPGLPAGDMDLGGGAYYAVDREPAEDIDDADIVIERRSARH